MSTLRVFFTVLLLGVISTSAFAKTDTITIKSSMICDMCKENIRDGLAYVKGVKRVTFDLKKNEIFIKYKPNRISVDELKSEIAKIGYEADEKKPTKEAVDNLPFCCQPDGFCGEKEESEKEE